MMNNFRRNICTLTIVSLLVTTIFAVPVFAETQQELEGVFATRAEWNQFVNGELPEDDMITIEHYIFGGAHLNSEDKVVIDDVPKKKKVTRKYKNLDAAISSTSLVDKEQIEWRTCYEALRRGMTYEGTPSEFTKWKDKILKDAVDS